MNDFRREERTTTVVRHAMKTPAPWSEVLKLLHIVKQDMGHDPRAQMPDDAVWFEVGDDEVVISYELTQTVLR